MAASDSERGLATAPLRRTSGVSSNSAVVEESPRHEALNYCNFEDFLEHLGLDHTSASGLTIAAAQQMFSAPLPPQWSEQVDETSSRVYFFNRATGDSLWMHPQKSIFEDLLQEVQCWQPDNSLEEIAARADAHLRQAQRTAVEALAQWSAFDAPQAATLQISKKSSIFAVKTTGDKLRVTGFLAGITILVCVADYVLAEMGGEKAVPSGGRSFLIETATVLVCMLLPAAFMHVSKAAFKNNGKDSPKNRGKIVHTCDNKKPLKSESQVSSSDSTDSPESPSEHETGSAKSMSQAVAAAVRSGDRMRAERLLGEIIKSKLPVDTMPFNSVIHACAKTGDMAGARRWLRHMRSAGVEPNTISYNILMDASAKADDAEDAEHWLSEMIKDKVPANEVSYATVIHARAKRGETELAEHWLWKMLEAGVEPNIVSYNSLIYACGRKGDAASAERWLGEAEQRGLSPRVTTYTAVVDACAKSGDVERAEKWMEKMKEAKVEPNVVSYSAMIDACAKVGDAIRAQRWHQRMRNSGVQPNAHSFSAVINACAKSGNPVAACEEFDRMEQAGVVADVVVYSGLLDACAKAGDLVRAKEVFARMKAAGVQPNVVAYASLARPFAHRGEWQEVEHFADDMQKAGLVMNEYFLYALLLGYASARPRQSERAEQAFRKAYAKGIEANKHVLTALGRAVGRGKAAQIVKDLGIPSAVETELRAPRSR